MSHRCPTCGHLVESARDKLGASVFFWSGMTLFFWGLALSVPPQWAVAWWAERTHLTLPVVVIPAVAVYYWVQYLRERRKK